MQSISVNRIDEKIISVKSNYSNIFFEKIKSIIGSRWNSFKKYWEIPYQEDILNLLKKIFNDFNIIVDNNFYLYNLEKELKIRKYSNNTIKNYKFYNIKLLNYIKKEPQKIDQDDIKSFLLHLVNNNHAGASTINIALNGLKFYYKNILNKDFIYNIKRPKKDRKLPIVYNFDEIKKILNAPKNIKHRLILKLIYSSGIRVEEASKLKISDIDIKRKTLTVFGKNRKQRLTILSEIFIKGYLLYLDLFKPFFWLFEGQKPNSHISIRSMQKIFEEAKEKAGITKKGGIHTLRHSFSTHLLEDGIDISYIQKLLGHANIKTTLIYTHVSNKKLSKIESPLDKIYRKEHKDKNY